MSYWWLVPLLPLAMYLGGGAVNRLDEWLAKRARGGASLEGKRVVK